MNIPELGDLWTDGRETLLFLTAPAIVDEGFVMLANVLVLETGQHHFKQFSIDSTTYELDAEWAKIS